jgi:integrase
MTHLSCPQCGSTRSFKDGFRSLRDGRKVQRWLCKNCACRFSQSNLNCSNKAQHASIIEAKGSNRSSAFSFDRQVCDLAEESKNLAFKKKPMKTGLAGAERQSTINTSGKIVSYILWLKKQGYAETTIIGRVKLIKQMAKNANLDDPESIKEMIAKKDTWSLGRKELAVECYSNYLIYAGGTWDPPKYRRVEKLPFIPTEGEIDQLIAACGRKTGTFLQLLKETGARCGEAWHTEWSDVDTRNNTIRIKPEKHSNPRIIKVSRNLIERLTEMPHISKCIFGGTKLKTTSRIYERSRKLASIKTKNPRLQRITFHTLRHWKATIEYHRTKDILHVMRLLGHKNIKNTLRYTQLVDFSEQDYISKVAWTLEEACKLVEGGFQFVCDFENAKLFRKPK